MCNCISKTNEALKEKGIRLVTAIRFGKDLSTATAIMPIQLEKIDPKNRKINLPILVMNYCPLCGEKLNT